MWCSVGIKPFLFMLINHCFSSAGFFNGNLWKLSLCSDSDWPTDRLLQPTAAQRPGIVILNTYYSISNFAKNNNYANEFAPLYSFISHSVPVCLFLCHLCSTLVANKVLYTKTNIHNTLSIRQQPCPEMTSSCRASRFTQPGRKVAQTSFFFANMVATMAQKFD